MKFKFKVQSYQTDAVSSVVDVFKGQVFTDSALYRRDYNYNNQCQKYMQVEKFDSYDTFDMGYKNDDLRLNKDELLKNIRDVQKKNNLIIQDELVDGLGACSIDVEMETGTGKTYVYIKTMYELNKNYGWSKFIVVVPSIAIREGVKKSFEMTEDHFMHAYGKKIRYFVYDSNNLNQLDTFSSDANINVMIINMQAFNTFKEGGNTNAARIIYSKRDEFGSRRPIDVLKANRPILILDEPQKMGGTQTQKALKNFNPLFSLNYSATHVKKHNLVYALDAVDAYNMKLVKKIQVKGFSPKNLSGTNSYLYLDEIILDTKKPPRARVEMEIAYQNGPKRERRIISVDDSLYELSKGMEQYKDYLLADINPLSDSISFTNGIKITKGTVMGDISEDYLRRIQIRETIRSHFEKEESLFSKGVKTLSLFFIDEVKKYRVYDEDGNQALGEYAKIFEEEYEAVFNEYKDRFSEEYLKYLNNIDVNKTHNGYFSIDKKGHIVNSDIKRGKLFSDDISAYDLILKDKERLLSFEEPTRFIFSHSALREGWDNPNIFQICTLKKSDSENLKRQEVGRGLRICVDETGSRLDYEALGRNFHQFNKLTVIASESYEKFVADLQEQTRKELRDRPRKANEEYFIDKHIIIDDEDYTIDKNDAREIFWYLIRNNYITKDEYVSDKYHDDLENNKLTELPEELKHMEAGIHTLIQSVFNEKALDDMVEDGNKTKIYDNDLNENFHKKEFQELWKMINHKYIYRVDFDSDELIEKAVKAIDEKLNVSGLQYTMKTSEQKDTIEVNEINEKYSFGNATTVTHNLDYGISSSIKYDLLGRLAHDTVLTRRTIAKILMKLEASKFNMYKANPEEFMSRVAMLINEQKASMVVEHIYYDQIEDKFEASIFTDESGITRDKAIEVKKHIKPYLVTDGSAKESVEKRFAHDLEGAEEVCVYAKLPRGFFIPTPVGNYNPDWAIAFNKGTVKHIFFVAETKGTMESMQLRPVEQVKIDCAKKLFNEISTDDIVYHDVDSYQSLLNIMPNIKKNTH